MCSVKIKTKGFSEKLYVGCERNREVNNEYNFSDLSKRVTENNLYSLRLGGFSPFQVWEKIKSWVFNILNLRTLLET